MTRSGGLPAQPRTARRPGDAGPDYLAPARAAFLAAAQASPTGVETVALRFAGRPVRLRVAGPALAAQVRRAFAVLVADDAASADDRPALTIDAWDRSHTGVGCPGVAYAPDTVDALGGGLVTQFGDGDVLRFERAAVTSALDRRAATLLHCVRNAAESELHLRCKPFPELLAVWYRDQGVQQVHAGLVAHGGRGVLFAGAAGAGKTTAALACSLAGFDFLGDDHVGIELAARGAIGHALYACIRADEDLTSRLPALAAARLAPIGRWERKGMVCLPELPECRAARTTQIAAIVVTEVRAGLPTRLVPLDRATALRRLAPSSLLVPLGARGRGMGVLGELVRRLPSYRLEIGDALPAIPDRLAELLARMG